MRLRKLSHNLKIGIGAGLATSILMALVPASAADHRKIENRPFGQLKWETSKEGVGFAALEGNRFESAYMAMVKLPAGLVSPPHTKSATMYGMVVEGTITNVALGADPIAGIKLSAGSYYEIPAGLAHISSCISKTDCVTFLYQDGKFDFLPVSP